MRAAYIAGPMSGVPWYNFPTFIRTDAHLQAAGWLTINPALIDLDHWLHEPDTAPPIDAFREGRWPDQWEGAYEKIIQRDLDAIMGLRRSQGDAIALLPGWEKSKGARAEAALGLWKGLKVAGWRTLL